VHLEGGRNRKHRGGRQAGAPGPLPHADSGQLTSKEILQNSKSKPKKISILCTLKGKAVLSRIFSFSKNETATRNSGSKISILASQEIRI
jgi:hypothetical protein